MDHDEKAMSPEMSMVSPGIHPQVSSVLRDFGEDLTGSCYFRRGYWGYVILSP